MDDTAPDTAPKITPDTRPGIAPDAATLTFGGTATTLLQLGPFTVLTDPNFLHRGQRAYLGKGLVSKRLTEPAITPQTLAASPQLDAVVLSHLHGDHFDRIARRELDRSVPILTTREAADTLRSWGFSAARALATWEQEVLEKDGWTLSITSVPGVHGPGVVRRAMPPVMGSVLELRHGAGEPLRLYLSGDTLCRPWLRDVVDRLGPLDTAVVHLGGTRALGILVTMDATQGADLVELLEPQVVVPVHYDDYSVFRSPLSDFLDETLRRGLRDRVRLIGRGQTASIVP